MSLNFDRISKLLVAICLFLTVAVYIWYTQFTTSWWWLSTPFLHLFLPILPSKTLDLPTLASILGLNRAKSHPNCVYFVYTVYHCLHYLSILLYKKILQFENQPKKQQKKPPRLYRSGNKCCGTMLFNNVHVFFVVLCAWLGALVWVANLYHGHWYDVAW